MIIDIPKSAFAEDSDEGQVTPVVGDKVDLSDVVGMIKAENGDNLSVEITSVNGVSVKPEAAEEAGEEQGSPAMPMDEAGMRAAVAAEDAK